MSLSSSCVSAAPTSTPARIVPPIGPSQHVQGNALTMPALMLAALYALPIVIALRPVNDADIWWHLSAGQWVSEHHAVPVTDPFSRWGADKTWIAYSWLFEVLVYRLYETFGLAGIVAYRLTMSLAVVAALHRLVRRREPSFLRATLLTAVAAIALEPLFSERPWLFTILFSTLTLDVLLDLRDGRAGRGIWLLPLLYALWANLHIQFVYGLFLLGLACVAPAFAACGLARNRKRCWVLTGLCLLATLANPYHVRLYGVVMELAAQSGPLRYINEMRALDFREASDWAALLLGAAAVFALGWQRRLSSFEVLLLAAASIFAFRSQRDVWFLILAAAAILVSSERTSLVTRHSPLATLQAAVLSAGLMGLLCWQRDLSEENLRRKVADVFPVEAAALIAERGYSGPLFNDYDWGGFLIWTLPQLPVVLDGRANLHGDERILRLMNTWGAGPGWRDDPDLESAGIVLANARAPLGCVLVLDERFQLVHEDAITRIFVRKQPATPAFHSPTGAKTAARTIYREEAGTRGSRQSVSITKHGCGT